MQNITELRSSLLTNYEQMKNKSMPIKTGKELANTAGKIINTLRLELEYNTLMGLKIKIPFLDSTTNKKITIK